jgi:hypothetical protein
LARVIRKVSAPQAAVPSRRPPVPRLPSFVGGPAWTGLHRGIWSGGPRLPPSRRGLPRGAMGLPRRPAVVMCTARSPPTGISLFHMRPHPAGRNPMSGRPLSRGAQSDCHAVGPGLIFKYASWGTRRQRRAVGRGAMSVVGKLIEAPPGLPGGPAARHPASSAPTETERGPDPSTPTRSSAPSGSERAERDRGRRAGPSAPSGTERAERDRARRARRAGRAKGARPAIRAGPSASGGTERASRNRARRAEPSGRPERRRATRSARATGRAWIGLGPDKPGGKVRPRVATAFRAGGIQPITALGQRRPRTHAVKFIGTRAVKLIAYSCCEVHAEKFRQRSSGRIRCFV